MADKNKAEGDAARRVPLTEAEIAELRAWIREYEPHGMSPPIRLGQLPRLLDEVERLRAPRKLSPAKEKKWAALMRNIKADVAAGYRVTLVTLSAADMERTAAQMTAEELRLIRFDIPGLCLATRKEK